MAGLLHTTDYGLSNERVVVPAGAVGTPVPQMFAGTVSQWVHPDLEYQQSRPVGRYGKELVTHDCLLLAGAYTGQVRTTQISGY